MEQVLYEITSMRQGICTCSRGLTMMQVLVSFRY
ncbi:hypothetical protein PHLH4_22290 [Pseudomonas sp. St316]|nr:hypothetical protein PHLH4_22290 [Pseudomonas sp. St316]